MLTAVGLLRGKQPDEPLGVADLPEVNPVRVGNNELADPVLPDPPHISALSFGASSAAASRPASQAAVSSGRLKNRMWQFFPFAPFFV